MSNRPLKQEEGWIAFLDLLGTKQAVMESGDREGGDTFASFFDSICVSGSAYKLRGAPLVPMSGREWAKLHVEPYSKHYTSRVSAFSDSFIVASGGLDEDFFGHVISIIQSAWEHGLAIRGALAYGSFLADPDGRPLRGVPIVDAARWEAAQDWAWISVCPESLVKVAGESPFLREADVPTKQGAVKTYALRPRLPDDEAEADARIDAEKLADITYKAWRSARNSGLEGVSTKCRNTLRWLEQDRIGAAFLEGQDAEQLQLSFVDEEYKIRIRLNADDAIAAREPFRTVVEALARQLECLDVQWDADYKWCVLRVRYAGSPLRRHLLQNAVTHSFHGSGLSVRCDIAPAEIDLFQRDKEYASDPVKSLVPPGNLATFVVTKGTKVTASSTARFSLATGLIPATSSETLVRLMVDCYVEGDLKTAAALAEHLDTRVPPHVWPIAQNVLTAGSFKEIVGLLKFVPGQSEAAWWANGGYWYNRALLLRDLGQLDRGMESAAIAVAFKPSNADAWDETGQFYHATGRASLAIRWHEQALRLSADSRRYRNHLGLSLMAAGKLDEAERVLLEAIELDPGYWHAMSALAWVHVNKGDGTTALRYVAAARAAGAPASEMLPAEAFASWKARDFTHTLETLKHAPAYKYDPGQRETLDLLEMHCLIEEGRGPEVLEKIEAAGGPQSVQDAWLLLYAQALISLGRSADARDLLLGREVEGGYENQAAFVAELARRESGTYDSPIPNPVERPLRRPSLTLCLSTIRRAAQYAIV